MTLHVSHNEVIVRRASVSDIERIGDLADEIPLLTHWPRGAYWKYCAAERQQDHVSSVTALFIACLPFEQSLHLAGFAAFSAVSVCGHTECELGNMAVAEAWRRKGIGRRLLAAGVLWARTWRSVAASDEESDFLTKEDLLPDLSFWLEVRASNQSAIVFYESLGFQAAGRRPGYYANPAEDAIRMTASASVGPRIGS